MTPATKLPLKNAISHRVCEYEERIRGFHSGHPVEEGDLTEYQDHFRQSRFNESVRPTEEHPLATQNVKRVKNDFEEFQISSDRQYRPVYLNLESMNPQGAGGPNGLHCTNLHTSKHQECQIRNRQSCGHQRMPREAQYQQGVTNPRSDQQRHRQQYQNFNPHEASSHRAQYEPHNGFFYQGDSGSESTLHSSDNSSSGSYSSGFNKQPKLPRPTQFANGVLHRKPRDRRRIQLRLQIPPSVFHHPPNHAHAHIPHQPKQRHVQSPKPGDLKHGGSDHGKAPDLANRDVYFTGARQRSELNSFRKDSTSDTEERFHSQLQSLSGRMPNHQSQMRDLKVQGSSSFQEDLMPEQYCFEDFHSSDSEPEDVPRFQQNRRLLHSKSKNKGSTPNSRHWPAMTSNTKPPKFEPSNGYSSAESTEINCQEVPTFLKRANVRNASARSPSAKSQMVKRLSAPDFFWSSDGPLHQPSLHLGNFTLKPKQSFFEPLTDDDSLCSDLYSYRSSSGSSQQLQTSNVSLRSTIASEPPVSIEDHHSGFLSRDQLSESINEITDNQEDCEDNESTIYESINPPSFSDDDYSENGSMIQSEAQDHRVDAPTDILIPHSFGLSHRCVTEEEPASFTESDEYDEYTDIVTLSVIPDCDLNF